MPSKLVKSAANMNTLVSFLIVCVPLPYCYMCPE